MIECKVCHKIRHEKYMMNGICEICRNKYPEHVIDIILDLDRRIEQKKNEKTLDKP